MATKKSDCSKIKDPKPPPFIPSRAYFDPTKTKLRDFVGYKVRVTKAFADHRIEFTLCSDAAQTKHRVNLADLSEAWDSLPTTVAKKGDHGWLFVTPEAQQDQKLGQAQSKIPWKGSLNAKKKAKKKASKRRKKATTKRS